MPPDRSDPRPRFVTDAGVTRLEASRCVACRQPVALSLPACPRCGGTLRGERVGPEGTVWSHTTVHIGVPGREPPYRLAYVDLDDGPRILAHARADRPLTVGERVRLLAPVDGDPCVEACS